MPGLDPKVVVHSLAVSKDATPIKQSQRRVRLELLPKIEAEIDKLRECVFIQEVKYPIRLANIVVVMKKNGQLHICVDYRDLNRACPKDEFPLPITKLLVDATTGFDALSFMDEFFLGTTKSRWILKMKSSLLFEHQKTYFVILLCHLASRMQGYLPNSNDHNF